MLFQHETYAALTRLAVNPNAFLIGAAHVRGIDGQVRDFPTTAIHLGHPFFNRILVRSRKSRKDQLTGIGMTFGHCQFIHRLCHLTNFGHLSKVQGWINPLAKQIHSHRNDIAIPGTLAVAKQCALDPLSTCH